MVCSSISDGCVTDNRGHNRATLHIRMLRTNTIIIDSSATTVIKLRLDLF